MELFDENTDPEMPSDPSPEETFDTSHMFTIRPNGGQPRYVTAEAPLPVSSVIQLSGLTFNGSLDIFVEGRQINMADVVQPGQTITLLGNVKGG